MGKNSNKGKVYKGRVHPGNIPNYGYRFYAEYVEKDGTIGSATVGVIRFNDVIGGTTDDTNMNNVYMNEININEIKSLR